MSTLMLFFFFFFQAEDGIRDLYVTGVQTCALPISVALRELARGVVEDTEPFRRGEIGDMDDQRIEARPALRFRSEEHTSELQSRRDLVCRLLLEKKKKRRKMTIAE